MYSLIVTFGANGSYIMTVLKTPAPISSNYGQTSGRHSNSDSKSPSLRGNGKQTREYPKDRSFSGGKTTREEPLPELSRQSKRTPLQSLRGKDKRTREYSEDRSFSVSKTTQEEPLEQTGLRSFPRRDYDSTTLENLPISSGKETSELPEELKKNNEKKRVHKQDWEERQINKQLAMQKQVVIEEKVNKQLDPVCRDSLPNEHLDLESMRRIVFAKEGPDDYLKKYDPNHSYRFEHYYRETRHKIQDTLQFHCAEWIFVAFTCTKPKLLNKKELKLAFEERDKVLEADITNTYHNFMNLIQSLYDDNKLDRLQRNYDIFLSCCTGSAFFITDKEYRSKVKDALDRAKKDWFSRYERQVQKRQKPQNPRIQNQVPYQHNFQPFNPNVLDQGLQNVGELQIEGKED